MNPERPWVRALVVFALGLAAISGLSAVLEALSMPRWVISLAVLGAFVATAGLAANAALHRQ
ncbi:MAG TPA: hypothetical protein VMN60_08550 [Longimicrobiales bacterium]|nr:hypothetical protein [Longimicrobiales bacterium]